MSKVKLDKDEKQILEAFEAGEFKSVLTLSRKKQVQEAATHAFKKDKRINIRISSRDLDAIQKRALMAGSGGGKGGGGGKDGGSRRPSSHPGPGGNWPSTSGKPSGGGRGNRPSMSGNRSGGSRGNRSSKGGKK